MNINYVCLNCYACIIYFVKLTITIHTIIYLYNICVQMQACYIGLYYTDMLPSFACVHS